MMSDCRLATAAKLVATAMKMMRVRRASGMFDIGSSVSA
jgi:hypothetical protein